MNIFILGFFAWIIAVFVFIFLWSHFKSEMHQYDKDIGYDKDKE